ncbi:MAG: hypothetical protein A3A51_00170 [Candidatus Levybacteria bacterium RIFCSPLOWO2_01_FULL_39_10]|nr:MAG: hypothetical protein A3A51_00170 [Candidatus Levybacteria bacterium RIFCSPLOWO2_01_FULL_39_10]
MKNAILAIIGIVLILTALFLLFTRDNSLINNNSSEIYGYWNLTEYSKGKQTNQVPDETQTANIIFEDNGRVTGTAFCNLYSGTYSTSGNDIEFSPFVTTEKACLPDIMTLENIYLRHLENVTKFEISGSNLYLKDSNGNGLLVYKLRDEPALEGTDWNALGYNNGRGGVVSLVIGTKITALFENGTVTGTSSCNSYSAPYALGENNSISIGTPAVTLIACEEDVMLQEQEYLNALQNSTVYQMTFDGLELLDSSGSLQATFINK